MPGSRAKVRWVVVGAAVIVVSLLEVKQFVQANQAPPATVKEIKLGTAKPGTMYALRSRSRIRRAYKAATQYWPQSKTPRASSIQSGCIPPTSICT